MLIQNGFPLNQITVTKVLREHHFSKHVLQIDGTYTEKSIIVLIIVENICSFVIASIMDSFLSEFGGILRMVREILHLVTRTVIAS